MRADAICMLAKFLQIPKFEMNVLDEEYYHAHTFDYVGGKLPLLILEEGLPGYEQWVVEGETLSSQTQLDEPTAILRFLGMQYSKELYNIGRDAEFIY
jgi:hypothetical protein